MGSEKFKTEYVEYLEKRNAELLNRMAQMKEIYENKIFSKDLRQHYLISTLFDMLDVCTIMPDEIDLLFEKLSEVMSILVNVLSTKSEMVKLREKISKLLDPECNSFEQGSEENNNSKTSRKAGTVKVSPMISGHIISTEPRICLNRVSLNRFVNPKYVTDAPGLSPIFEVGSDAISSTPNKNNHSFEGLRTSSEKLNIQQAYLTISQESPKSRFKGTKIWKKSLSSNSQTQNKKDANFTQSNENVEKPNVKEMGEAQLSQNVFDPLEGPSWLYNQNGDTYSSPKCFVDVKRRRNRYARAFDKEGDDTTCAEDNALNSDNKDIPCNESCDECDSEKNSKKSNNGSGSLIGTVDETTSKTKNQDRVRKRTQRNSSRRYTSKRGEKNFDLSDSSYEGDNEENFGKKCKSTRSSCRNSSSKSKSPKSQLEKMSEREALVVLEDCMKTEKNKSSQGTSNASGAKANVESLTSSANEEKNPQTNPSAQRGKRKVAPTNLKEPKLKTKLRRD